MSTITIGRDNSCDIVINDSRVSRFHAGIEYVTEEMLNQKIYHYLFSDKSCNGTLVNGKYIRNQSIVVYESFPYTSPVEPDNLLASDIPISWTIILNAFRKKNK